MPIVEIKLRRNTSVQWLALDPILESGEPGYELDTGRFKMGDGQRRWSMLSYFLPTDDMTAFIDEVVEEAVGDFIVEQGAVSQEQLADHVNSETPHPIYDDGPSLLLLYQNAKV